jgi:diguanylate cyclase (GGDEF)-like protein
VPLDIYAPLVDALFEVQLSLFIGAAAAGLATLITAWKTGSWILFAFGVAIVVVTYLRVVDMRAYRRAKPGLVGLAAYQRWERRYVVGAALHVALLGAWCFAAFVLSDDPFVRLFAFSVVLAYMIGISGRNFASRSLVFAQAAAAAIPLAASLFYVGGLYYTIFGIVLIPFFLGIKLISERLRRTLLDAVIATRDVSMLAKRFDTALNNMPHGLAMFDAEHRLVVHNRRLAELFGAPEGQPLTGKTLAELVRESSSFTEAPHLVLDQFLTDLDRHLAGLSGTIYAEIREGQSLAFTTQPMENGGSVVIVEDITERRNAEARIQHMARFDPLTGLPNRTSFHHELDRKLGTLRRAGPLAILFVDLDQFKQVNDTLGHPCGDELLCAVADRLRAIVRPSDIVARFGGDEFIVMQAPVNSSSDCAALAQRLVDAISVPYQIDGHNVVIGASIGIAMAPRDGVDSDLLLKNADMALYHAKADGRSGWRFFEPAMDIKAQARRTLELDLRQALADGSFDLAYQPLFNIRTMRITTCEALLRWRHPRRGMVPPSEFIPVAEDMGIILQIGEWVIRRACHECMNWPQDVAVAVNLSPVQFKRDDMAAVIAKALSETGLPANRLEVEITESVLLQDIHAARQTLERLREMGVRLSLDDFGTGYSGLSYLHSFPFDKVKIDRSFIQGLRPGSRQMTLLKGISQLSAALGMTVTVEGVETEEQLALLMAEEAIDEAQGYLFSVALPGRQVRELIASPNARWSPSESWRAREDRSGPALAEPPMRAVGR